MGSRLVQWHRQIMVRTEKGWPERKTGPAVVTAREIMEQVRNSGALPHGVTELEAVVAVLCTLNQRLSAGQARALCKDLPSILQPVLDPCVFDRPAEPEEFDRQELVRRVAAELACEPVHTEDVVSVVLTAIIPALSPATVKAVAAQLPNDLRALWIDAAQAAHVPVTVH
jgi:uncharacterized protein (DUF2267 family)